MSDVKKKTGTQNEDEDQDRYFRGILNDFGEDEETGENDSDQDSEEDNQDDPDDEEELTEEEQRRKNKNAEEARKRREAEAKAKKEAEEKAKKEAEEKAKKAEEEKSKSKKEQDSKASRREKLGEQLSEFHTKYSDVDLESLDKDKHFKRFIDGKLLGKKNFTELYEDFIDMRAEFAGKSSEETQKSYRKKAKASSGSSVSTGSKEDPKDVYTEEELEELVERLPLMTDAEADKIMGKFEKSVAYHKNKK